MTVQSSEIVTVNAARRAGLLARALRTLTHPEARRSLTSLADQAIVSGTSFATTIILGRMCLPEELGVYFLALTAVWFVQDIFWEVVSTPYEVLNHRRRGSRLHRYTGSAFAHQMLLSLALIVGLLIYYAVLSVSGAATALATAVLVLAGALPLLLFREFIRQFCFGRLRSGVALAVDATVASIQLSGLLLLAYANMLTAATAYSVIGMACGVAGVAWLLLRHDRMEFRRVAIVHDWQRNWHLSRWTLLSMLLGRATSYLMPWIILFAYDAKRTALLGMCTTLVGVPNMVIVAMCNCMRPRIFREYSENGMRGLKRMLLMSTSIFAVAPALFLIVILLSGDRVGMFFYGQSCVDSGIILAVMTLGRLAGGMGMALAAGLWAVDRPQDNVMPNVWDLVLTLGGAALLVPTWGVIGAAAATTLGNIAGTAARWHKLRASLRSQSLAAVGATA